MPRERRLYLPIQAVPKRVINAFIAAEDKNFYEHGGIDFSGIARAGIIVYPELRQRPPPAGRLHHHPAGRQELPAHQRAVLVAQDQGSAAGDEDRAHLLQGEDPRALSQRNLSRHGRLRRGRRVAALFRQVGARIVGLGGRLSRGAAQGAQQLSSVPPARARLRAPQLRARSHGRGSLHHRAGGGEGQEGAVQDHAAADRRAHLRGRIFRRGGPPLHQRQLHREEALRGRPLGAHHARSQDAGAGAQGADRRLREFRRAAGLSRRRQQARAGGRLGREARRGQGAVRRRAVAARGGARVRRPIGPHRIPARARARRRRQQGPRERHRYARRREVGEGGERAR